MSQDATVNAADIARLVDVGRAAVSNWRRRHEDFPRPVGGTASSPLFSLAEIEQWLRRNGKEFRVSLADRVWQLVRAGDDLSLGRRVGRAGATLLRLRDGRDGNEVRDDDPELVALLTELAVERGHAAAFEFLCERYLEVHSRRLAVTPPELAALMVRLVAAAGGTLYDPACGLGTLLLNGPQARATGQELSGTAAPIAACRLALRDVDAQVATGDSLRADAFPGQLADAVVCDPPFNERAWGYDELTGDPRWVHGLPPRGESELAWVQHCLAHVRPGGKVAVLMPAAAAGRRPGKRIRGNLLRSGALRAVISLPSGGQDLWVLCRPEEGARPPSWLLLFEAPNLAAVESAWRGYLEDPERAGAVRIIDLLDDHVDLSPAGQRPPGEAVAGDYLEALHRFQALRRTPPALVAEPERRALPVGTLGELVKAGLLGIEHAPARLPAEDGDLPVLTADDLAAGRPPTGRTSAAPGLVWIEPGDVVASVLGAARMLDEGGMVLGPSLTRYRTDPDHLDPDFLAGCLRAAAPRTRSGSSRIDVRRTRIPRIPLADQQGYAVAFRRLIELEDALRATAALGESLVTLGFAGLIDGHLRPDG
ncbi:N-6 DNA methylase [Amycolatopsis nigrescens]|uniref:N-6 DNA methylase n=1 Tax=Amycolatopsis nigrescens TaxID=381445 RepID=UPI00037AA156|nr:N-6 DNA methylase [Amycolatopsis nigrescens]